VNGDSRKVVPEARLFAEQGERGKYRVFIEVFNGGPVVAAFRDGVQKDDHSAPDHNSKDRQDCAAPVSPPRAAFRLYNATAISAVIGMHANMPTLPTTDFTISLSTGL